MEEIGKIEMVFLKDRGFDKLRINFVSRKKIFGLIKPLGYEKS